MANDQFTKRVGRISRRAANDAARAAQAEREYAADTATALAFVVGLFAMPIGRVADETMVRMLPPGQDEITQAVTAMGPIGVAAALGFLCARSLGLRRIWHLGVVGIGLTVMYFAEAPLISTFPSVAANLLPESYIAARTGG